MPQSHGSQLAKFTRGARPVKTLIRGLVSSTIEHGQIQTTVPKAKAAAKMLQRVITLSKRQNPKAFGKAQSWLHNHRVTMPELFTTLRERYADRTGGYTRVIRTGLRSGDRAPMAIVELVDSPGEVRFEMLARKLGRKIYEEELRTLKPVDVLDKVFLEDYNNWYLNNDVKKALRFRPESAREDLRAKAEAYRDLLRAEEKVHKTAKLQYDVRPARPAHIPYGSIEIAHQLPKHEPEEPTGRFVRPGELLPAMAVKTPTKPVPFADRHLWPRMPVRFGGRGTVAPSADSFGSAPGEKGAVRGVDGVSEDGPGWAGDKRGGNGEFDLGRSPIQLARRDLGRRRTPERRWRRDGDGMGG